MASTIKPILLTLAALAPQAGLAQARPAAPASASAPSPASASASAPAYPAVADFAAAVRGSAAFRAAAQQVQTQYKVQIDAYTAASTPLQAELDRIATEIRTLQNTAGTTQATLQARTQAFEVRRDAIQRQLAPLSAPFERPLSYAEEQITAKLDQAVRAAMNAKRVNMLVNPQAVSFILPTANITGDITAQLNALIPSASIAVPASWQPGGGAAPRPAATPRPSR